MRLLSACSIALALSLAGCGEDKPPLEGAATGTVCPSGATDTYDNWARNNFFGSFCIRCHSADSTNRNGAPSSVNFDTVEQIRSHRARIDELAGLGPDAENAAMPPKGLSPTDAERVRLSEWLACGAP